MIGEFTKGLVLYHDDVRNLCNYLTDTFANEVLTEEDIQGSTEEELEERFWNFFKS